jgi:FkbM family methyltransferase
VRNIIAMARGALPESVKMVIRRAIYRLSCQRFQPYLKKKEIEGVSFDFWIADAEGRDWYDTSCTDPTWIEMRFLKDNMLEPGDVVFECGSHHGCTTILLSNWVGAQGKVVAFEALPRNCDILERNMAQNSISNVTLERKAVGSQKGRIKICEESDASVAPAGGGLEVEMTHLDDYKHLMPTLLKLDVEGFELQVLQGARKVLSTRPKLAIEIHTEALPKYGASVAEILSLIGADDYDLWVQWDDRQEPVAYDFTAPIETRVHLFGIPRARSSRTVTS